MQAKLEHVRSEVPLGVLVKWTFVSAVLHALLIGALCAVSYLGFQAREAADKAKEAELVAAAKAEEAAKAAATPPAAVATTPDGKTPDATAATPPVQATTEPPKPVQAETILGIDKVAKPDEMPKSPFSSKGDDLLKDLK